MKLPKKLIEISNLHEEENQRYALYFAVGLVALLAILVRISLVKFKDGDYTIFSSWYDFIKLHGIHSFKYGADAGFSNYNPPYSYFLYIAALLPVSKIVAIKGLLGFFDIILAISIFFAVKIFRPHGHTALIAGIATMFLPTVLFTGVLWGQFDQLYVAFILFSLCAGLRYNSKWAWVFFGVALAVKFQAIFFLPVLGIMIFKRILWYDFMWSVGSFLILTLPPVLAGRSIGSLLSIYPDQAKLFSGQLVLKAPNMYQWFPNNTFPYFDRMGIALALAAVLLILAISLIYKKYSNRELMIATTLLLYVVPFLLPSMHERYFFPAGIASFLLAAAYPTRMFIGTAILMQAITLLTYSQFLFGPVPIPYSILAFGVLFIIYALTMEYIRIPLQAPRKNKGTTANLL